MSDAVPIANKDDRGRRLACVLVSLATFALFLPCLRNDFVDYDDAVNFRDNLAYRGLGWTQLKWMFTTTHLGPYQPLSWMTLGLDFVIWGMKPLGYHLTNITIHAFAAGLFTAVAIALYRRRGNAAQEPGSAAIAFGVLAGLIWAMHPLRVEAVAWITERREVLCGLLTLLTLLSHLSGKRWYVTACCALLALLAKATAVVVPVMLILIDLYSQRFERADRAIVAFFRACGRHAAIIILTLIFCGVAIYGQFEGKAVSDLQQMGIFDRACLYIRGLGFYAYKTLAPVGLGPLYEITTDRTQLHIDAGISLSALLLCIAGVAWRTLTSLKQKRVGTALPLLLVYFAMVAPVGGLIQVGTQLAADRYTYQPGWALSLAAAASITWLLRQFHTPVIARTVIAALIGIGLAIPTYLQELVWRDPETLWTHEIEWHPETAIAHYNLGLYVINRDGTRKADLFAERHFRAAVKLRPAYEEAYRGLGNVLKRTGRPVESLAAYEEGLRSKPDHLSLLYESGRLLWELNRRDEALARLKRLGELDPAKADTHVIYGRALAAAGRMAEATAAYERAMQVAPGAPTAPMELAWLLATHPDSRYRNGPRALQLAQQAAQLADAILRLGGMSQTNDIQARLDRTTAAAYAENGDFARAIELVENAKAAKVPGRLNADELLVRFRQQLPMRVRPGFP